MKFTLQEIWEPITTGVELAGLFIGVIQGPDEVMWQTHTPEGASYKIDDTTLFPIASCTKPMTALCTLLSHKPEEITAPIQQIWPAFEMFDPTASSHMTLQHVLSHQSGLPAHTHAWIYPGCDRATFMRQRLPHLQSVGHFEGTYRYSNVIYALAGFLCEVKTGMSWENHIKKTLWQPLKMSNTVHLSSSWQNDPNLAPPFDSRGQPMPFFYATDHHPIAPASEVMSTGADLLSFVRAMLSPPKNWAEAITRMTTPQVLITRSRPWNDNGRLYYGLGLRIEQLGGHQHLYHTGQCSGYTSLISWIPSLNIGIVLCSNTDNATSSLFPLLYKTYHLLKGLPYSPPPVKTESTSKQPEKSQEEDEALTTPLNPGVYAHPGYGFIHLTTDGKLIQNGITAGHWEKNQIHFTQYDATFTVISRGGDLLIPFESTLPPIVFSKKRDSY